MAKLYVSEYSDQPAASYTALGMQIVKDPPLVDQTPVTIGAGALASAPFSTRTRMVRLHTDVVCSILIGPAASTVATANNQRMAANQTEYKMVDPGYIVSVITNS